MAKEGATISASNSYASSEHKHSEHWQGDYDTGLLSNGQPTWSIDIFAKEEKIIRRVNRNHFVFAVALRQSKERQEIVKVAAINLENNDEYGLEISSSDVYGGVTDYLAKVSQSVFNNVQSDHDGHIPRPDSDSDSDSGSDSDADVELDLNSKPNANANANATSGAEAVGMKGKQIHLARHESLHKITKMAVTSRNRFMRSLLWLKLLISQSLREPESPTDPRLYTVSEPDLCIFSKFVRFVPPMVSLRQEVAGLVLRLGARNSGSMRTALQIPKLLPLTNELLPAETLLLAEEHTLSALVRKDELALAQRLVESLTKKPAQQAKDVVQSTVTAIPVTGAEEREGTQAAEQSNTGSKS